MGYYIILIDLLIVLVFTIFILLAGIGLFIDEIRGKSYEEMSDSEKVMYDYKMNDF